MSKSNLVEYQELRSCLAASCGCPISSIASYPSIEIVVMLVLGEVELADWCHVQLSLSSSQWKLRTACLLLIAHENEIGRSIEFLSEYALR